MKVGPVFLTSSLAAAVLSSLFVFLGKAADPAKSSPRRTAVVDPRAAKLFASAPSTPGAVPPVHLANISTRLAVGGGDNVLIAGFIITGSQPKKVIVRALGPVLPVLENLADPTLELHDSSGGVVANDNWRDPQEA